MRTGAHAFDVLTGLALVKGTVDSDPLEQLRDDGLDESRDDVADEEDDEKTDQVRDESDQRVEPSLKAVGDMTAASGTWLSSFR
jgi:hypothetical protein